MIDLKPRKRKKDNTGKLVLLIVLTILLIALIAVALWLSRTGKQPAADLPTDGPPGTAETGQPPEETEQTEPTDGPPTEDPELSGEPEDTGPEETDPTEAASSPGQTAQGPQEESGNAANEADDWVQPSGSAVVSVAPATEPPRETEPPEEVIQEIAKVTCDQLSLFSGQFVEDGRDELVYDVLAILVTNRSDQYLDIATFTYIVDGKEATFVATGLHPNKSAWVLEENRMKGTASSVFTFVDVVTGFREDVTVTTDRITVTVEGNMMTAKNNTNAAIGEVYVYYKVKHDDGNYLGGITYRVDFGTLEPGAAVTKLAGHFDKENSEVVRISWKTE